MARVPIMFWPARERGFVRASLLIVLIVVSLAAGAVAGYAWREREAGRNLAELAHTRAMRDRLKLRADALAADYNALGRRTRKLESELELERAGRLEAAASLKSLQDELSGVREQLSFYQTIVPGGDSVDLKVQEFRVTRADAGYRFRTVLTRPSGRRVLSKGTFTLAISGERDGKRVRLGHADLVAGRRDGMHFSVQHFARLEGEFVLPEGFAPERVVLEIRLRGDQAGRMQRIYAWKRAVG